MFEFVVTFFEVRLNFVCHLAYILFARVVGLEPTTNGFGDHYSAN